MTENNNQPTILPPDRRCLQWEVEPASGTLTLVAGYHDQHGWLLSVAVSLEALVEFLAGSDDFERFVVDHVERHAG